MTTNNTFYVELARLERERDEALEEISRLSRERDEALNDPAEQRAERYAMEAVSLTERLIAAESQLSSLSRLQEGMRELAQTWRDARFPSVEVRRGMGICADELEAALSEGQPEQDRSRAAGGGDD